MKIDYKTKILAAIIQELEISAEDAKLSALLFLFCKEYIENNHYYDFLQNNYTSIQAEYDLQKLLSGKALSAKRYATELDFFEKMALQKLKTTWKTKNLLELEVYLKSKIVNQVDSSNTELTLFTIGYEGLSPDSYINKLSSNAVKILCDVRKNAYSQKQGFSARELKLNLQRVGIKYVHIPELGIASEKRENLSGYEDYKKLFAEYELVTLNKNNHGLPVLQQLLCEHKRVAITCFEKSHNFCHRGCIAKNFALLTNLEPKIEHL